MAQPVATPWVTTWVKQYRPASDTTVNSESDDSDSGFNLWLLIPIILASLMATVLVIFAVVKKRRRLQTAYWQRDSPANSDCTSDSGATDFLGVMWSTGGDSAMTPHVRLRDHSWTEPTTGISYSVYAVHTSSSADDPTWSQCPASDGYSSLIVPCHRRDEFTDGEMAAMTTPAGSAWVTTWLEDEFAAESSGFNELLLVPIILGSLAVIGVGWLVLLAASLNA
ncbi:hypothetical protein KRP22_012209 [Phytophthora ramorum]|nr:hypothetical protein KRP22_14913 [Phytophthora ramorum]